MTVTTTVPATAVDVGGAPKPFTPTRVLGIGPMGVPSVSPTLTLRWQQGGTVLAWPFSAVTPMPYGCVPARALGPAAVRRRAEGADRRGRAGAQPGAAHRAGRRLRGRPGDRATTGWTRRPAPAAAVPAQLRRPARTARLNAGHSWSPACVGGRRRRPDRDRRRLAAASRRVGPRARVLGGRAPPVAPAARLARRPSGAAPDRTVVPGVGRPGHVPTGRRDGAPAGGARRARQRDAARGHGRWWRDDRLRPPRRRPDRAADGGGAAQRARGGPPAPRRCRRPDGQRHRRAEWGARGHPRGSLGRGQRGAAGRRRPRPRRRHHRRAGWRPGLADTAGAALGETTFRAGEVAVLALPNAAATWSRTDRGPALWSRARRRRVALRRGGEVALDETVDGAEVEVPRGVERLAVAPLGAGAVPPSAAGWHAGMTLPYVGWGTALGVEATVRVEGPPVARRGDRFRAGWVEAAELVSGNASVITRFSRPVDLVVVVIDDPVGRRRPPAAARARRGPPGRSAPTGSPSRRTTVLLPATGPSSPTASRSIPRPPCPSP